jgi:aerobic carbon-monoxide dehydrogenase large subunit
MAAASRKNVIVSILGNEVVRVEDARFLTGTGTYVEDLDIAGTVEAVFVRSSYAHGRILSIDIDEACGMPGVLAIYTAADIAELPVFPHVNPAFAAGSERPLLARDTVRFVGEPYAVVVAETRTQATDAAEVIFADIEPLEVLIDPRQSALDETLIHPAIGTNAFTKFASKTQAEFSSSEVVVELEIEQQRLTAAPLEPRAGLAYWTTDEPPRLVAYSACQGAHPLRDVLMKIYSLPAERIRAIVPDVGGGFGAKSRTYPDELLLGWLSKQVGRPVRMVETRTENMMCMPHGRGQFQKVKLGGTRDGRITAYQLDVVADAGAYPMLGAFLPMMTQRMLTGVYHLDNVGFTSISCATNTISTTAYRGAGRPEAAAAIERIVDRYAFEIGMDPVEVRKRNLVPKFLEPYTTGIGTTYDVGDYPESLRLVTERADYAALRAEQASRRKADPYTAMGIGVAVYVEITAGGPGSEFGSIELQPDGRMRVLSGSTPYGQGHQTTWAMIVADRTGVPMDRIDVITGDTDLVVRGGLTVGSRSVQLAGTALAQASTALIDLARDRAARLLEADVADVVHDRDGARFHVAGSPAVSISWDDLAADLAEGVALGSAPDPLVATADFTPPQPTFPSGAHLAVVEVDVETGKVTVVRMVAVDDAGNVINPLLAEGQVHGGLAQGIAQALLEAIRYDELGNLVTSNFADYPVISAAELPSFEIVHQSTPTWVNELGAKGFGESGTIGSIPAVQNAVVDALSHLGVRHIETPCTPDRVWAAIQAAAETNAVKS